MTPASAIEVLIVDDHQTICSLVSSAFEKLGFTDMNDALDGEEALRAPPSLPPPRPIISNFNRLRLDGLGLFCTVRANEPVTTKAFRRLTARARPDSVLGGAPLGAANHLVKPAIAAPLKEKIESVVEALI